MVCRVCSRNLENEEAKARYRAVENTTTVGCNGRKTNKQTINEYPNNVCMYVCMYVYAFFHYHAIIFAYPRLESLT